MREMDYTSTPKVEEIESSSIKMNIQETHKILKEMRVALAEFEIMLSGQTLDGEKDKESNCLCDEARTVAALAYECLQRLMRIKDCIIS